MNKSSFWIHQPIAHSYWKDPLPRPISFFYMHPSLSLPSQPPTLTSPLSFQFHCSSSPSHMTPIFTWSLYFKQKKISSISFYPMHLFFPKLGKQLEVWLVDSLYVQPLFRKKGIATYMISKIIQGMQECQIPYVFFYHDAIPISIPHSIPFQSLDVCGRSFTLSKKKSIVWKLVPWSSISFEMYQGCPEAYSCPTFLNPEMEWYQVDNGENSFLFHGTVFKEEGIFTLHHYYCKNLLFDPFPLLCSILSIQFPSILWKKMIHSLPKFYRAFHSELWKREGMKRKIYAYNMYFSEEFANGCYLPSWTD